MSRRRVFVTGVGTVAGPVHGGADAVAGWWADTPSRAGDRVSDERLGALIEDAEARRLSRIARLAVAAGRLAVADAAVADPAALGVIVGTEFGDMASTIAFADGYLDGGPGGLSALLFPNTVMNAMAAATTIAVGAKQLSLTLTVPVAAGELAVARAAAMVGAARADIVLAGGVDARDRLLDAALDDLAVRGRRGEGATFVVLESDVSAAARGARILGEIRGAACRALGARPHGVGRSSGARAIAAALADAGIGPGALGWVHDSANGDDVRDAWEERLLAAALEPHRPPRTSLARLVGQHAGAGALAVATGALCAPVKGVGLVHALARGGTEVALIVGPPTP
jgi:3-oxoacyl-[acyl-carrier-protein] synthase II